jgi:membrane protease YdiL (CAAX protease family)
MRDPRNAFRAQTDAPSLASGDPAVERQRRMTVTIRAAEAEPAAPARAALGIGFAWLVLALLALAAVTLRLDGALPVFTVVWLVVPLVSLARHRDPRRIGIRPVEARLLGVTVLAAGVATACLTIAVEPWSGAYGALVDEALSADPVDTTFGWLARHDGAGAWLGFVAMSGLVTIFAEELFFRGWLLQALLRRTRPGRAITAQAAAFALVQAVPALLLAPLEGAVFVAVYAFAAVGLVGGWAAWRTASIWPSLVVATTANAVLTALLV